LHKEETELQQLKSTKDNFTRAIMSFSDKRAVHHFVDNHNYLLTLADAIADKNAEISAMEKEVEDKRLKLLQATKEKKIIQKLKEKSECEFMYSLEMKEQAFLDEIAMRKVKIA
jgi:flagellar FliJ protein